MIVFCTVGNGPAAPSLLQSAITPTSSSTTCRCGWGMVQLYWLIMVVELSHTTSCALYRVNGMHTYHGSNHVDMSSYPQSFRSIYAAGSCTAAVGSSIGTAVGVSVSVTFVVSLTTQGLVTSIITQTKFTC